MGYRYRPLGAESYRLSLSVQKKVIVHPYWHTVLPTSAQCERVSQPAMTQSIKLGADCVPQPHCPVVHRLEWTAY